MLRISVLALALLAGCVHMDRAMLVTSTATLACDWMQTRAVAQAAPSYDWERNPMLGKTPSVGQVDAYFAGSALANLALWAIIPEKWRAAAPAVLTATQIYTIADNTKTIGVCGSNIGRTTSWPSSSALR